MSVDHDHFNPSELINPGAELTAHVGVGPGRNSIETWELTQLPWHLPDKELAEHPTVGGKQWVPGFRMAWQGLCNYWNLVERLPHLRRCDTTKIQRGTGGFRVFVDTNDE